jgi:hypothetical protein
MSDAPPPESRVPVRAAVYSSGYAAIAGRRWEATDDPANRLRVTWLVDARAVEFEERGERWVVPFEKFDRLELQPAKPEESRGPVRPGTGEPVPKGKGRARAPF